MSVIAKTKTGVVAVVDNGGNIVALQRDNNAVPHNTLAAQKKVVTHPETQNLSTLSQLLLLGGGVLVKSGDRVIDAIGMAGMGVLLMTSTAHVKPLNRLWRDSYRETEPGLALILAKPPPVQTRWCQSPAEPRR
ncbi:Domain of uncharacterised function (DUF336) [Citrobacter freundii]|nr:Domain of uncharacterised function (DUF336) [Citrobacter freundii]